MTPLENQLLRALWKAWNELNVIRAADGVPYTAVSGIISKSSVDENYFSDVVDECAGAIEAATGAPPKPWDPE